MEKKVLVIDDSALMRRVISDIINSDEQLTVADTATNGMHAMDRLTQGKQYDAIVVDIQMPKMNGVQFLKSLNMRQIRIPVIVVSSVASESADETIEALSLGAMDFVKKPSVSMGLEFKEFQNKLLRTLHVACGLKRYRTEQDKEYQRPVQKVERMSVKVEKKPPRPARKGEKLVVIASSTGGPKALQSVVPYFPKGFAWPVVIVQHMPAGFTASLAKRLNDLSPLPVKEAEDGEILKPGMIYLAQGGKQCELVQKASGQYEFSENDKPPRGGLKPCADIFFESLVDTSFEQIICAVLTGMGADGTKGIQLIKRSKKVKVVAQDEKTCVVYGMPKAAYMAKVTDSVVPLEDVTGTLVNMIKE